MIISGQFLPFSELVSVPGVVPDCFCLLGSQNLVAFDSLATTMIHSQVLSFNRGVFPRVFAVIF